MGSGPNCIFANAVSDTLGFFTGASVFNRCYLQLLIGFSCLFKEKNKIFDSILLNVNIFGFVTPMKANWILWGFGQNKKFEDAILGFGKHCLWFSDSLSTKQLINQSRTKKSSD